MKSFFHNEFESNAVYKGWLDVVLMLTLNILLCTELLLVVCLSQKNHNVYWWVYMLLRMTCRIIFLIFCSSFLQYQLALVKKNITMFKKIWQISRVHCPYWCWLKLLSATLLYKGLATHCLAYDRIRVFSDPSFAIIYANTIIRIAQIR